MINVVAPGQLAPQWLGLSAVAMPNRGTGATLAMEMCELDYACERNEL
jgi:hypothetical protein